MAEQIWHHWLSFPVMRMTKHLLRGLNFAVMKALTTHFASLKHLQPNIKDPRIHYNATETEIHPLALMDIDESIIDNNITILLQSAKDIWVG